MRCVAAGTRIRTPSGAVLVEAVRDSAEIVILRNGVQVVESVKWVGHREVDIKRHARPEQAAPVKIRAGAIAEGQPSRDLQLSPEHAIFIDGALIQARSLVNGGSITQERGTDSVTYYHIELDTHGAFFAEDLAVESYLDNGDRSFFETEDGPLMLHPQIASRSEFDVRKTGETFAPFLTEPEAVEPIWRRLSERSKHLGYVAPGLVTTNEADLHIVADGRILRPTADGDRRFVFVLPAGVASATLVSRFAIPLDLAAYADDARRIGIAVSSISIGSRSQDVVIPFDFPTDANGWHEAETLGSSAWRWTDGSAELPLGDVDGTAVVTVVCRGSDQYPVYDDRARPLQKVA